MPCTCTVPNFLEHGFQANATAYFGTVQTSDPIGTVVFGFRIIIDLNRFTDNDLSAIIVNMVRNNLVQRIFKFSDGANERRFLISLEGGIVSVNSSRRFPEIRLIDNRYAIYEDSVIYQEAPPSSLELPTTLNFDLNLLVVGEVIADVQEQSPFAVGTVFLAEPSIGKCMGGSPSNVVFEYKTAINLLS